MKIPTARSILDKLEQEAAECGLSMAQVARHAGIQPSLVSHWKAGKYEPRLSSLDRLRASIEALRSELL